VDDKPDTEYGGAAGLIQVHEDHVGALTGPEKRGMIVRAAAVEKTDPLTGFLVPDETANAVDPVSGLEVLPEYAEDGSRGVSPVKTPPPTESP